jgi:hypothetical protein
MRGGRTPAAIFLAVSAVTMVVAIVGFLVTIVLNTFFLDDFDAYGEVPVPGSATLHLPAGEANVAFHTMIAGSGGGLPIPELGLTIVPPAGVADPVVTEDIGVATTVNNDARRRVWVVQIPTEGDYLVKADGNAGGFINPHLGFGHAASTGSLPWVFGGLFVIGLVDLVVALWWLSRRRRVPAEITVQEPMSLDAPYTPTDDGIRLEQLKTLAALRDSGALTTEEFEAEKRRILNS